MSEETESIAPAAVPGVPSMAWPTLPVADERGIVLAVKEMLDASQWWPAETLERHQFRQLASLLSHAWHETPFYRERLAAAGYTPGPNLDPDIFARLPILTRAEVQAAGDRLHSRRIPGGHGRVFNVSTSGSTGEAVKTLGVELVRVMHRAFILRQQEWTGWDLSGRLAAIRYMRDQARYPAGARRETWTSAGRVFPTGPALLLSIRTRTAEQLEWLDREAPDYLVTYPTNLLALLEYCAAHGRARPAGLRGVGTMSEALPEDARALCQDVWGLRIQDVYSAEEAGPIAFQCPETDAHHLQSESLRVEILDESGTPRPQGATGRVVVTPLHNLASPLIRYELGDHAVVGAPCVCGRGLPVLDRILGRTRNMLKLAGGERAWASLGGRVLHGIAPVRQFQFVQTGYARLELRIVANRPVSEAEEQSMRALVTERLPVPMALQVRYVDEIPRARSGKFDYLICEI